MSNMKPTLFFDGSYIDVLWDNHEAAINWFQTYFQWNINRSEQWLPDPNCEKGKTT